MPETTQGKVQEPKPQKPDLDQWPKGSPERKAAVRAYKQLLAEWTNRNRVRAGRKPKGAEEAEADRRVAESIAAAKVAQQQARHIDVIEWAIQHAFDKTCPPEVPSETAKTLWRIAHKDPQAFVERYYALLVKGDKSGEEEEAKKDLGAEANLKLVEDWLATHKRKQPRTE